MTKKDIEVTRQETMEQLNQLLDNFKKISGMTYAIQITNLVRLVEHMQRVYEFELEFPDE